MFSHNGKLQFTQKLYYDETNSKRVAYFYTSVKTINDLLYNITPSSGTTYYCWEDNSLWLWMNKWRALYSTTTYPSAYVYDSNRNLNEVYRYDQPNIPADDNGLLKDGSVVIRDRNRIIKRDTPRKNCRGVFALILKSVICFASFSDLPFS